MFKNIYSYPRFLITCIEALETIVALRFPYILGVTSSLSLNISRILQLAPLIYWGCECDSGVEVSFQLLGNYGWQKTP